jgi:hypothetical protein
LSSDPKLPIQSIIPHADVHFTQPIYLAYTAFGSGHYDAICYKPKDADGDLDTHVKKCESDNSFRLLKGC